MRTARKARTSAFFCSERTEVDLRKLMMGCTVAALTMIAAPSGGFNPLTLSPVSANCQFGVASWYGPGFQGRETASGPPFDMNAMTCAHRQLPLGTSVRVTNLLNRRSLILRVNDRGPYVGGRVLDVSRGAAKSLGFLGAGLAPVRIEILTYPPHCITVQPGLTILASARNHANP